MKNFHLALFTFLTLLSCSNDDGISFNIDGQFVDNLVECNSISIEQNCIKFISFVDNSSVYILYEGDIMLTGGYTINRNVIIIENIPDYPGNISFQIINENTLKRIQDGALFLKKTD